MASLLYRLGRGAANRAWLVIISWIAVLGIAGVGFLAFGGALSGGVTIPGTATEKVTDTLAEHFGDDEGAGETAQIVFASENGTAFTDEQRDGIASFLADLAEIDGVAATIDPFTSQAQLAEQHQQIEEGRAAIAAGREQLTAAPAEIAEPQLAELDAQEAELEQGAALLELTGGMKQVADDGSAALGMITFDVNPDATFTEPIPAAVADEVKDRIAAQPIAGVEALPAGSLVAQGIPEILGPGEVVGLVIAAITLFVMLGTLIGAGLPLITALLGVGVGVVGTLAFSAVVDMNSVTPVLGVMLGLAVGIDYALFIINRHRTQLRRGMQVRESIALANGTSGNAVVFAGLTVIVALLALNITGIPFLGVMGTVGAVCIAVAILVAVTLTPALLSLVGTRMLPKRHRAASAGDAVHRPMPTRPMSTLRSIVTLVAGVAALLVVAIPALDMRLGLPDAGSEPTDSVQYRSYTVNQEKFGDGVNGPLLVVAQLPEAINEADAVATEVEVGQAIAAFDDVVAVVPIGVSNDQTMVAFQVVPAEGPNSVSTEQLVHALRDGSPALDDVTFGVAGNASANIDISEKLADALPIYLGVVVGLSLLILILVFRSILVPITATAGFVLSVLAAFGGVTAIFKWGWFGDALGVHNPGVVLSFLPVLLIGILFGLAMDYQLFLVSGMREAYAHGVPAKLAVRHGMVNGRTVVTAAAIIMVSVFGGFVFSNSIMIQSIGFGLAFGVFVDAFIVRMLLIPAAMHLLGTSAWWIPKWLDRILPDVDVEGSKLERSHPVPGAELTDDDLQLLSDEDSALTKA